MIDLKKKLSIFFKKYWPFLLIALLVAVFFWKVFLFGWVPMPGDFVVGVYYPWLDYKWGYVVGVPVKNPITTDVVSFMYPMQSLAASMMRLGQWPLWNPLILAGEPLLANFQAAPFSPTVLVWLLFDNLTAWSLQVVLQHALVILFTYFLLREWKVSKVGSLVGGLAFGFGGYNLLWSQWNGHTLTSAFIPLVILFEDRFIKNGRYWDGLGVSVAVALQVFSGYPQAVFYTFFAMVFLWMVRFKAEKKYLVKTVILGIFGVLALGLAAPQIMPGVELLKHSQREIEPHPFEWAFLPWEKTITLMVPDYFGNHATANYWGPQDYTSNTGFVGVVAVVLAGLGVTLLKKKREVVYVTLILILSLFLSYPTPLSIYFWKSGMFGMQAASAHRALVLFNFAVAILVGFGVDVYLGQKKYQAWTVLLLPTVIMGGFLVFTLFQYFNLKGTEELIVRGIPKYWVALRNLVWPMLVLGMTSLIIWVTKYFKVLRKMGLGILLVLMTLELFRFGWKFNPIVPREITFPTTPVLEFLMNQEKPFRVTGSSVIPINLRMPYGLESLEGYDAVYPVDAAKFIAAVNGKKSGTLAQGRYAIIDNDTSQLMDLVNTKYYLALKKDEKGNPSSGGEIDEKYMLPRFNRVFEDKTTVVLESKTALPRAFMVYEWETILDRDEILDSLLNDQFPLGEKILLEEVVEESDIVGNGEVLYVKYQETGSELVVETDQSGMLFISDTYYPGWKAYVDGIEQRIYRADYAFRAIKVSAGKHLIRFTYQPDSFFDGLKIAGLTTMILTIFFIGRGTLSRYTSLD